MVAQGLRVFFIEILDYEQHYVVYGYMVTPLYIAPEGMRKLTEFRMELVALHYNFPPFAALTKEDTRFR